MSKPPSFLDKAQALSFCTEMFALIPENLLNIAYTTLEDELKSGIDFPDESLHELLENIINP
jgi:hypothetical protein